MKFILLLLFTVFFSSTVTHAETLDDRIEKLKKVIRDDGRAEFCVITIPSKGNKHRDIPSYWPIAANCVGTVNFNKGSLQEKEGCTAFILNANEKRMYPLIEQVGYKMSEGKRCAGGGFEGLMDTMLAVEYGPFPDLKVISTTYVKDAFTTPFPFGIGAYKYETQILFSDGPAAEGTPGKTKWEVWLDQNKTVHKKKNSSLRE